MSKHPFTDGPGWSVGRSIVMELEMALSLLSPHFAEQGFAPDLAAAVPQGWRAQWPQMLGAPRRWVTVLTHAAFLAGVLREEDYSRATLVMRELSVAEALAAATLLAEQAEIAADTTGPPDQQLVRLLSLLHAKAWESLGFEPRANPQANIDLAHLPRILRGGDLQHRFWHWLDQAYYEFYSPWREQRSQAMAVLEQRALASLGALEQTGAAPATGWLPGANPLLIHPRLVEAVVEGSSRLFFWVDPFGLFDFWSYKPGLLCVTFHEPEALFTRFREEAETVAERVKALADPTRLMILRIIRHFGMDNTQMADYLGIARPTVSIHAKMLREAGLIETGAKGRQALHRIQTAEVRRLFADLERFLDLPQEQDEDPTRPTPSA